MGRGRLSLVGRAGSVFCAACLAAASQRKLCALGAGRRENPLSEMCLRYYCLLVPRSACEAVALELETWFNPLTAKQKEARKDAEDNIRGAAQVRWRTIAHGLPRGILCVLPVLTGWPVA